MIIGMDFGTTNSGIATYDGRRLNFVPFGSAAADGNITRTALYITNDQTIEIGRAAIDRYQEHNLGRPIKMERTKIGVITIISEATYWDDIFSERDVLSPGRLFLSFKSSLASAAYRGTAVGSLFYALEDIVAIYLHLAKIRAERTLGKQIDSIVLGRPVHFSTDPEADALAEQRLIEAAWRAGYKTVYMQYEPVAVALQYATTLDHEEHVLVFDFGGGTLDIAAMRLDGRGQRTVLATGGIPIAGDVFDQRIVRNRLAQRLGEGSHFGPRNKRRGVPTWIYDDLSNWQTIALLQAARHVPLLNELLSTTDKPNQIAPLVQIINQNYGLTMFDAVEQAKRTLSDAKETLISFAGPQFAIDEPITRQAFAQMIQGEVRAIDQLIDRVVRDAGLAADDIDMVVRTGGSSQIPVFVELLRRKFGADRVRAVDAFSSVTAGLGVMAHRIEAGEAELPAHQRSATVSGGEHPNQSAPISFLQGWIAAQEQAAIATDAHQMELVQLAINGQVRATTLPESWKESQMLTVPLPQEPIQASHQAVIATLDESIILVTSSYRLLLTTPRRLLVLQELGRPVGELEQFAPGERVSAIGRWADVITARWLAILNNNGDLRLLDCAKLADSLARALPVQLDYKSTGTPVALLGINEGQEIVVVTSAARAVRVRVDAAAAPGFQAIKRDKNDTIVTALHIHGDDQLLVVAATGAMRVVHVEDIALATEPGSRGRVVAARFVVQTAAIQSPVAKLWLVTAKQFNPAEMDRVAGSTARSHKNLTLAAGDQVRALIQGSATAVNDVGAD